MRGGEAVVAAQRAQLLASLSGRERAVAAQELELSAAHRELSLLLFRERQLERTRLEVRLGS